MIKNFTVITLILLTGACATGAPHSQDSLIGTSRPPKNYPQHGYLLDDKGTYTFEPSSMSR